jgi:hypothetical protein
VVERYGPNGTGWKRYISSSVGVAFRLNWPGLEWGDITERVLRSVEKIARGRERKLRGDCGGTPSCVEYEGEGPSLVGGLKDDEDDGSCQPQRRGRPDREICGRTSFYIFSTRFFFFGGDGKRNLIRPDVDSPGWRTFVPVTTSNDQNMGKGRHCSITAHSGFRLRT